VYRTKRRFVEEGLEPALSEQPRAGAERKLSGNEEALLIAVACSKPPSGRARWTLELLAGEVVRRTEHTTLSRETVRRRLAEQKVKPWQQRMWCIPTVDAEYVARLEDILELYTSKPSLNRRTAIDFAECMRELVTVHYPEAQTIRVVLDNLSTHKASALYEAFPPAEARAILRRLEFHYVPKHASWLNMVEIEIGVLVRQCLDRRIADRVTLSREISAWQRQRNQEAARIRWLFGIEQARQKLGRLYPALHSNEMSLAA